MNELTKLSLPEWAQWIAQDEDGSTWVFEAEPHLASTSWYENEVGRSKKVGHGLLEGDWRESLRKLT